MDKQCLYNINRISCSRLEFQVGIGLNFGFSLLCGCRVSFCNNIRIVFFYKQRQYGQAIGKRQKISKHHSNTEKLLLYLSHTSVIPIFSINFCHTLKNQKGLLAIRSRLSVSTIHVALLVTTLSFLETQKTNINCNLQTEIMPIFRKVSIWPTSNL